MTLSSPLEQAARELELDAPQEVIEQVALRVIRVYLSATVEGMTDEQRHKLECALIDADVLSGAHPDMLQWPERWRKAWGDAMLTALLPREASS